MKHWLWIIMASVFFRMPGALTVFCQSLGSAYLVIRSKVWKHIDYYDHDQVINSYYAECEAERIDLLQNCKTRVWAFQKSLQHLAECTTKCSHGIMKGGVMSSLFFFAGHSERSDRRVKSSCLWSQLAGKATQAGRDNLEKCLVGEIQRWNCDDFTETWKCREE